MTAGPPMLQTETEGWRELVRQELDRMVDQELKLLAAEREDRARRLGIDLKIYAGGGGAE